MQTEYSTEGFGEIKEEIVEILEEADLPVKPREEGDHSRKLSALALAVLVFYKVSGGPFGCEPSSTKHTMRRRTKLQIISRQMRLFRNECNKRTHYELRISSSKDL